jgi:hypothetical protein
VGISSANPAEPRLPLPTHIGSVDASGFAVSAAETGNTARQMAAWAGRIGRWSPTAQGGAAITETYRNWPTRLIESHDSRQHLVQLPCERIREVTRVGVGYVSCIDINDHLVYYARTQIVIAEPLPSG